MPLLAIYPKKMKTNYPHLDAHHSIIHHTQITKTTYVCPSMGEWIKRIRHTYRHTHVYIHTDLEDKMLSEIRQTEKIKYSSVQFSSVAQCLTCCDPMTVARQASLYITNSQSLPKLMSTELVMLSKHLILCRPLLLPPSIFSSIRVFSNESALRIR